MQQQTSKWISTYLYHNLSFELVIHKLIQPLIKELKEEGKIERFFFIRYWEKGPHIRLRIVPKQQHTVREIELLIEERTTAFFTAFPSETCEYKLEFNDYIQETARYGGEENIKISEQHFEDSSLAILNSIEKQHEKWDYSMAISFAIQMHLIFAKNMMKNTKEALQFFNSIYSNWFPFAVKLDDQNKITPEATQKLNTFFDNAYTQQKQIINILTKHVWNEEGILDDTLITWDKNCAKLCEHLSNSKNIVMPEWFSIDEKSNLTKQQQILFAVYDSYIHMTNNRLGIIIRDEAFIAYLIAQGLKNIIEENTSIAV